MHTIRIKSDFKHFKTRENAGTFVASEIVLGAPGFAFLHPWYCTQTALPQLSLGDLPTRSGVSRHCSTGLSIARSRPTNNTGKFYHAWTWILYSSF